MLQVIRDHAQGWIAWVIVGLIILTFALFGIDQYANGQKTVVVATVNGKNITANQFLTLYNRQKTRLQQQFGEMYDQVVKDDSLRDEVLNSLVESQVILQWAKAHNMIISNQQLAVAIHQVGAFHKKGKFDQTTYKEVLLKNGFSVAQFESEQRQFLLENQVRQLVSSSSIIIPNEVKRIVNLQQQERKINFLTISEKGLIQQVSVSDAQIKNYYDAHKADFMIPQKVVLNYVLLSQAALAKKVKVTPDDLQNYYEENKNSFTIPEKRQASHILIRVDGKSKTASDAALAKIKKIQALLKKGDRFADLAKKYSQDPGSAKVGGDLGVFQQGMMVPEFDKAVFGMKVGQVSGIVKTSFGFHLIKLVHIFPKKIQSFAQVKSQVESQYRSQEADKAYFKLSDKMSNLAYEQSDTLEPTAEIAGLKVKTTAPFSRQGGATPITSNPKVIKAAFSEDVLKNHLNSASIDLNPTTSVIVRIKKVIPASEQTLAEVSGQIKKRLQKLAATKLALAKAQKILAAVQKGKALKDFESSDVKWSIIGWINRQNHDVAPVITQAAYKMPKPIKTESTFSLVKLASGDSVVLELTGVREAANKLQPAQLTQLKGALKKIFATSSVDGMVQSLVEKAKIEKKSIYKKLK